jgi:hypothetical protein
MYLGQLTKIRDVLASCKLSVTLDERDANILSERQADDDPTSEAGDARQEIDVSRQVC